MKKTYLLMLLVGLLVSCKDTDGDKVYDKDDKCPDTFGLVEFNGCPDTDEDGIIDSEDECPDTYGLEEFNGCPDTDNDGIPDPEDDCPKTYGYEKYNGCPNNDHVKLLISECLESYSFSTDEINQLLAKNNYTLNSTINIGICDILVGMLMSEREYEQKKREFEEEKRRLDVEKLVVDAMEKELNEGWVQSLYIRDHGQYIIVLKGNVNGKYYLMQVISGGKCSTGGTMKFDETTFGRQEVWVRNKAFKIPAKLFTMKLIDSSKRLSDLQEKFN